MSESAEANTKILPEDKSETAPLYIVGIGASAGGLEALRELTRNLPTEVPATYIVAQHMSPLHKSLLTELVGRETHLDVENVTNDTVPRANCVYITPPRSDVVYKNGKLVLLPPKETATSPKPSVDRMMISIAAEAGENGVGVILSGTGSDGAYGIQAIRAAGGITIAQDDKTSKYDGMPQAAISTGCVDLVMSPTDIGTKLEAILTPSRDFGSLSNQGHVDTPMADLMQILLARTRVDFRNYKATTLQRRIERRMKAREVRSLEDYTSFCRSNPTEIDALFKDLLISVTWFFRDGSEFEELESVIEKLVKHRTESERLRVLITGCATGEEVYSIAMLLAEALGGLGNLHRDRLQIFATDIDRNALQIAREGIYSNAALENIPERLAERYLVREEERFQVASPIRDMILFSEHNACQDPPFLNLDLICCRNLLIYFNNELQYRVLSRFHYGMKSSGYLFLGKAESITGAEDMFKPGSDKAKIFRKRFLSHAENRSLSREIGQATQRSRLPHKQTSQREIETQTEDTKLFDALTRSICPDGLLVSSDDRILRVFGDMGTYVALTEDSRLQIGLNMLKPPYDQEARMLVGLALSNDEIRTGQVHRNTGSTREVTQLQAIPIKNANVGEALALLSFRSWIEETDSVLQKAETPSTTDVSRITSLQAELDQVREALQQTSEELETSNEELQVTNEELQSMNEEIQATNEELEISNEELQSTNEELVTVNEELHINTAELTTVNQELISVLENIAAPVLVLDSAFGISKASNAADELFRLPRPLERPHISQCRVPDGFPNLAEICNEALRLGEPLTVEVEASTPKYSVRCAPYADKRGQICGVTMLFVENG